MSETVFIKVKNYGPIKAGTTDLEGGFLKVPKFTFLIGDQGTGKSTVSKLLSTLSWTEKALVRKTIDAKSLSFEVLVSLLENQNLPKEYIKTDTEIEYRGNAFTISLTGKNITVRASNWKNNYLCPQIIYYPSERNILSVMDNPWDVKGLPEMIVGLATEYLNAQMDENKRKRSFFNGYMVDFDPLTKRSYVLDPEKKTYIPLSSASSGLQSVTPLLVVSDYLTKKIHGDLPDRMKNLGVGIRNRIINAVENDELKEKLRSFFSSYIKSIFTPEDLDELATIAGRFVNSTLLQIVEEPEQNLYPTSQVSIAQRLIENTNSIGKLIVTTHSPYILSSINNYIFAYDLQDHIEKYPKGLSKNVLIKYEDVSAVKVEEGRIHSILDDEARMIDVTEIDGCSSEINDLFDKLMAIREKIDGNN